MLTKISIGFAIYGVLIEFAQKFLASQRDFDVNDMVADAVGCAIGFIACNWLVRRINTKNKPL